MSILTTSEVGTFLGIDSTTPGLAEAIDQAEMLIAGKLRLATLEFTTYEDETRVVPYTSQQLLTKHGPVQNLTKFEQDGEDILSEVEVDASGWAIRFVDPVGVNDFDRVRSFHRMSRVVYSYQAGWTDQNGEHPLPFQVAQYAKSMAGLTFGNLLASGVYDTKLGDMTVKIQRETLEKNVAIYDDMLRLHARPY